MSKVSSSVQSKDFGKESSTVSAWESKPLLSRIDWVSTIILSFTPMASLYALFYVPLTWQTLVWSFIYYYITGIGITGGYHRLWAHRSYEAVYPVQVLLLLGASGALEGSAKWWCGGHRVHHRHTDTRHDPYSAAKGFWYAHMGWMLVKPDPADKMYADIRDLNSDSLIRFQHKYYLFVGPFMAFMFPTLVAGLGWGDWLGGYFFAGAMRLCLVHHSTFCVNSVAHYFGEHTYDDLRSPKDSIVTALLTLGEGYHNFHHEFPNDYRNGIEWYHYDPTKWTISFLNKLGLTYNLQEFPSNEIKKGKIAMDEKKLNEAKSTVTWPTPLEELPTWTMAQVKDKCTNEGRMLIIIHGIVHDVEEFAGRHPGGKQILQANVGRDGTKHFDGMTGVYKHSQAARNLLDNFRVAILSPEEAVETASEAVPKTLKWGTQKLH